MRSRLTRFGPRPGKSVLFSFQRGWNRTIASFFLREQCRHVHLPHLWSRCAAVRRRVARLRYEQGVATIPVSWSSPMYADAVLLHMPIRDEAALAPLVEEALRRKVKLIAAVGPDSLGAELAVDRVIVGDRYDPARFMYTTDHEDTIDALKFISASHHRKRFYDVWF